MPVDAISLEVFKNMFISVSEEMGVALQRTSYSPNIKERRDFSCAIFDPQGQMVAQAAHQPVHLGAMPASVQAALDTFPQNAAAGGHGDSQRPLPGWHPPAGHHPGRSGVHWQGTGAAAGRGSSPTAATTPTWGA